MNIAKTVCGRVVTLITVLLSALMISSCDMMEIDTGRRMATASLELEVSGMRDPSTRSSVGDEAGIKAFETTMHDLALFQFSPDGTLFRSYYYPSLGGKLSVQGRSGVSYRFVAMANMGDMTTAFPQGTSFSEVEQYAYHCGAVPDMNAGCPMACLDAVYAMSGDDGVLRLVLTRLMARYDLRLDCSRLKYGSFDVTSLKLCQAPNVVTPLLPSSMAMGLNDTAEGDYATASNLSALRSGKAVPFYVLENAQGVLLENNKDPWSKVPSEIGEQSVTCTYIEIQGSYKDKTGRLTAVHIYRMYLGDDSTTNFDILRGTRYDVTLTLSDDGFLKATWKAERKIISDWRTFFFNPDSYSVAFEKSQAVTLVGNEGSSFSLSENLISSGVSFDPGTMMLTLSTKLKSDVTGTLTATSWDKALTAYCQVKALRYRPEYTLICHIDYHWDNNEDQVGDVTENTLNEWMYFDAVTVDGDVLPVSFKIPGYPGCSEFKERYSVSTYGDIRVPGPADMPDRTITPDILKKYSLYVIVDGDEAQPSWSTVSFTK